MKWPCSITIEEDVEAETRQEAARIFLDNLVTGRFTRYIGAPETRVRQDALRAVKIEPLPIDGKSIGITYHEENEVGP